MTTFDLICLLLLAASTLFGLWRGFLSELFSLVGWVLGVMGALELGLAVGKMLPIEEGILRNMAGGAVVFFLTIFLVALVRICFKSALKKLGLGPFDHILGMLFGMLRGALVIVLAVMVMRFTALPEQEWWNQSNFTRPSAVVADKLLKIMPMEWYRRLNYYTNKAMGAYEMADPSIMDQIKKQAEIRQKALDEVSEFEREKD